MALIKTIELDSGIVLNYHRIVTITKVTNHATILEIAGYTSKEKRELEVQQLNNGEEITAYIDTSFMSVEYDENTTIKDWYDYLKTTEKYSNAEDDNDTYIIDEKKIEEENPEKSKEVQPEPEENLDEIQE